MKWNKNPLIMLINASQLVEDNYIQSVISVRHRATLSRFAGTKPRAPRAQTLTLLPRST